jgi:hypothetical protein
MSIGQLNLHQGHMVSELIQREIVDIEFAIKANNELAEEYKDKPELTAQIINGNIGLEIQLTMFKSIIEIIQAPTEGFIKEEDNELESEKK